MQDNKITDTSAADARKGKDVQGIPWERLSISREKYRQTMLEQYKNYENIPQSGESSEKVESIFSLVCGAFGLLDTFEPSFSLASILTISRNANLLRKGGSIMSSGATPDQ